MGHGKILETMLVQMELESFDGSAKLKINAYAVN